MKRVGCAVAITASYPSVEEVCGDKLVICQLLT